MQTLFQQIALKGQNLIDCILSAILTTKCSIETLRLGTAALAHHSKPVVQYQYTESKQSQRLRNQIRWLNVCTVSGSRTIGGSKVRLTDNQTLNMLRRYRCRLW